MFEDVNEAIAFAKNDQDGGIPHFYYEAMEVKGSDPVEYEDVLKVTIILKGGDGTIVDSYMREEYKTRWPDHWKAFCEGKEAPLKGIPLKEFPAMTPADIANCHRCNVRTVEDLANMPDVQLHSLGHRGISLKQKAIEFLEYRKGPDVGELKNQLAEQSNQLKEQSAQIERLEKIVGDNTSNVPKRAAGNGVSKSRNTVRKQQSRRKTVKTDSKDSSEKTG